MAVKRAHCHHQGGRAAGELEALRGVRDAQERRPQVGGEGLLHADGVHVVVVIIGHDPEFPVAHPPVEFLGLAVVLAHFEPEIDAATLERNPLRLRKQRLGDAEAAMLGRHREGVEAGERVAAVEQQRGVAPERAAVLLDEGGGIRARQQVAEAARADPIGHEGPVLERHQRRDVVDRGRPDGRLKSRGLA